MQEAIYTLFQDCTVCIQADSERGTGFWVAPGIVLTCAHVVKNTSPSHIQINWQNKQFSPYDLSLAPDWQTTPERDLAIIYVPFEDHPCVYLGRGGTPGDFLHSYGYPDPLEKRRGDSLTVELSGFSHNNRMLTLKDENIRGGFSGAPLLHQKSLKVCGLIKSDRAVQLEHLTRLGGRGIPIHQVYEQWPELKEKNRDFHQKKRRWKNLLTSYNRPSLQVAFLNALIVSIFINTLRFLGVFQSVELATYDWLMQNKRPGVIDDRITLVTIPVDELDKLQGDKSTKIFDSDLKEILEKINSENPLLVGIDIYRDEPHPHTIQETECDPDKKTDYCNLFDSMQESENTVLACHVGYNVDGSVGDYYPKWFTSFGFGNVVFDKIHIAKMIRRYILIMEEDENSGCPATHSLGYKLALEYFKKKEGIEPTQGKYNFIKINSTILEPLRISAGGYQDIDGTEDQNANDAYAGGYQILLNYRKYKFNSLTFEQILNGTNEVKKKIYGKIILIGYDESSLKREEEKDLFQTPVGEMLGIEIHAQAVSHILSVVIQDQYSVDHHVIRTWIEQEEVAWIVLWCILGGGVAWLSPSKRVVALASVSGVALATATCWCAFTFSGWWLPLVPPIIGLVVVSSGTTVLGMTALKRRGKQL